MGFMARSKKLKCVSNEIHENVHIYSGHLELSLVKYSG